MDILKTKKYLGFAGVALVILSCFLNFCEIKLWGFTAGAVTALESFRGFIVLLGAIYCLLVLINKFLKEKLPEEFYEKVAKFTDNKWLWAGIALEVIGFAWLLIYTRGVSKSIGFYLMIIGIVATIAHAILYKGEE